jgi:2-polyprenyl-3-methyl-5-hydroxy-6-metoxy-1,4-benzoquinol methylase
MILKEHSGTLLDIGCSDGRMTECFAKEGRRLFGFELNQAEGAAAKDRGIDVLSGDLTGGLPSQWNGRDTTAMFDVVFAGEIIEHIEDTDRFLREIHRVLAPSGALVITTPNLVSLENRVRMLLGLYPLFVDYSKTDDNHVRAYTTRALAAQLKKNGFEIDELNGSWVPIVYSIFPRIDALLRPLTSKLADWLPGLAMHAVIKARRGR